MQRAIELARESIDRGGGPFGAVVVRKGEVVGEGANSVVPGGDPTAHAEVCAIRAACARLRTHVLEGCEIYTSCEPCPMCLGAIHWARIDRVYFAARRGDAAAAGFDDELLYEELSRPIEARRTPLVSAMRDEALAVFEAWRNTPDAARY